VMEAEHAAVVESSLQQQQHHLQLPIATTCGGAQCVLSTRMGQVHSVSRVYSNACALLGPDYYSYTSLALPWGNSEDYEIGRKIGRGTYSNVFVGRNIKTGKEVVIKALKPTKKGIKKEVKIQFNLNDGPNIIRLLDLVKPPYSGIESFILEYVDNTNFKILYPMLDEFEIRYYMYQLLLALNYTHSKGIMHRDLKPHNVMIDRARRKLRLIDWGLAEFYHPGRKYSVSVGSRYYRGPELFFEYYYYDYSVDMWAAGCILAEMVFKFEAFFCGVNSKDQLAKIVGFLGTDTLEEYLVKYGITLSPAQSSLIKRSQRVGWERFTTLTNAPFCTPDALALLDGLLIYDHQLRYTAQEALRHEFFDSVRHYDTP